MFGFGGFEEVLILLFARAEHRKLHVRFEEIVHNARDEVYSFVRSKPCYHDYERHIGTLRQRKLFLQQTLVFSLALERVAVVFYVQIVVKLGIVIFIVYAV